MEGREDSEHYDFVNFDITSVTTPEQIQELDRKIAEIAKSPEIEEYLELSEGDAKWEEQFYKGLMEEINIEIKKDSDRIENAHKVFVALETGNLDEILEDSETQKWAMEVWEADLSKGESDRDLYKAGIEHSNLGFEYGQEQNIENNLPKVTPKSIVDTDKEQALTTTEVVGIKGFIKRLLDRFKGRGEK